MSSCDSCLQKESYFQSNQISDRMKDEHIPKNHLAQLHADYYYHVYNRTNNKELLFRNDDNRILFLEKYKEYLQDYLHTYAYCLLDNHFHLLVRIRSMPEIYEHVQNIKAVDRTAPQKQLMHKLVKDFTAYQWSSYRAFLSEKPTSLERTQVLDWFGGKQHFVEFHQLKADYNGMEDLLIED